MRIAFVATNVFTTIRFLQSVNVNVFAAIAGVREPLIAAFEFARERAFSCVSANVNLQVLCTCKALSAPWLVARKGLFARMNSNVIYQFVLCLERQSISHAFLPTTNEPHGRGGDEMDVCYVCYKVLYSIKSDPTDLIYHLL